MAGGKRKCWLVEQPQAEQVREGLPNRWIESEKPRPLKLHVYLSNPSPNLQSITNSMKQILPQVLRQTSEICLRLRGKFVYTISIPQLPRALHVSPNPKLHSTHQSCSLSQTPSAFCTSNGENIVSQRQSTLFLAARKQTISPLLPLPVNSVIHLWLTIISPSILPDATHTLQESAGNPGLVRKSLTIKEGVISPPHLWVNRPPAFHVTIQRMLIRLTWGSRIGD